MKKCLFILVLLVSSYAKGQVHSISGKVTDQTGAALPFASIGLLDPGDSTLSFFGITDEQGSFKINNIIPGKYLFQIASMGNQTMYKNLDIPLSNLGEMGILVMESKTINLNPVEIKADKIPILFKKDTLEYNAGSFKVKPDAAVEDLLKKLPGVEVDRAGNIKAQGEDVNKVLVDGKEFFGSDPKMATKNLPADAIEKVQVFNKKSEMSEFTGIDDGGISQTINLVLKDGKKSAYLGSVMAGGGTDEHYIGSAKVFRFQKNVQFAALGMLNNINEFGFSIGDYMGFNGGMANLISGDASFNSIPGIVNFGADILGLNTSAAGGLNYTYEPKKDSRFNVSYTGSGINKNLNQISSSNNYTSNSLFLKYDSLQENTKNRNHQLELNYRMRPDSTQKIVLKGSVGLTEGSSNSASLNQNFSSNILTSNLMNNSNDISNGISEQLNGEYMKRFKSQWKFLRISVNASNRQNLSKSDWENVSNYFDTGIQLIDQQYKDLLNHDHTASLHASINRKTGDTYFFEPVVVTGINRNQLDREQGTKAPVELQIDSLSPEFFRQYHWLRSGINLKRNATNTQMIFSLLGETGQLISGLKDENKQIQNLYYLTPAFSITSSYRSGRRLGVNYISSVNTPSVNLLIPVVNNTNPLAVSFGNPDLAPEYMHSVYTHWTVFDRFSFTNFFMHLNGTYTQNKISTSQIITNALQSSTTYINVSDDYRVSSGFSVSTPIKPLGLDINIKLDEGWNKGIGFINNVKNTTTSQDNKFELSFNNNRKAKKLDLSFGASAQVTFSKYSLQQSLNQKYTNLRCFSELIFTPGAHWRFFVSADVTQYQAESFGESVMIPLIRTQISYYFLKGERGTFTLEGFDLLNKNSGLERVSQFNYLMEKRSNIMGRYVMLSFKYRLSKFKNKNMFGTED